MEQQMSFATFYIGLPVWVRISLIILITRFIVLPLLIKFLPPVFRLLMKLIGLVFVIITAILIWFMGLFVSQKNAATIASVENKLNRIHSFFQYLSNKKEGSSVKWIGFKWTKSSLVLIGIFAIVLGKLPDSAMSQKVITYEHEMLYETIGVEKINPKLAQDRVRVWFGFESALPAVASAKNPVKYVLREEFKKGVYLREKPSASSRKQGVVEPGEVITFYGTKMKDQGKVTWYKVKVKSGSGWISTKTIRRMHRQ